MALNLSMVEAFVAEYRGLLGDKTLLRGERYRILAELGDKLQSALKDYQSFESELSSLIMHRVESAPSFDELLECHRRAIAGVENFFLEEDSVVDVHDLFRIIRDAITIRILHLVEEEMVAEGFGRPPVDYVWAGLGSEGRDEQTLMTDQDNMIVYDVAPEGFQSEALSASLARRAADAPDRRGPQQEAGAKGLVDHYFEVFAGKATDRLHEVGFDRCKGGVMSSFGKWRGTKADWRSRLEERMIYDRGSFDSLDVIILTDARPIFGRKQLLRDLMAGFFQRLTDNKHVMKDFIQSAVLMPTAVTFFGGFKTEKEGTNAGKVNIKLLGWAPLIFSVRMACLVNGIFETNTLRRIGLLREANVIKKEMEEDLTEAYLVFVRFRIMNQINARSDGGLYTNHVDPEIFGAEGVERLRKAMRSVENFQKYIQETLLFGQPL
jgi:signal-transduction protein with cAMP-binding, CBS, and nucleotidyltransferase domain